MHTETSRLTRDEEQEIIRREFDNIVGYEFLKEELMQICDSMRNRKYYEAIGAGIPHGLLLSGVPGVGKTTMAEAIARACGRPVFRIRRNTNSYGFIEQIRRTFEDASMNAPSMILLDDVDKFADGSGMYGTPEEYAALQTCIDEIGNHDVFVVATANSVYKLPGSLIRCGRFDRKRTIRPPGVEDTIKILKLYLKGSRRLADDVDLRELAMMACGSSCSYVESLANDAAVLAGYERSEEITMDHFVRAYLRWRAMYTEQDMTPEEKRRLAYYEAGRMVLLDIISPASLTIAAAKCRNSNGAEGYLDEVPMEDEQDRWSINIMHAMAGRIAVEMEYGDVDEYTSRDMKLALCLIENMIRDGQEEFLTLYQPGYTETTSNEAQEMIEEAVDLKAAQFYEEVRTILEENKDYLDRVADELAAREYMLAEDVRKNRLVDVIS